LALAGELFFYIKKNNEIAKKGKKAIFLA